MKNTDSDRCAPQFDLLDLRKQISEKFHSDGDCLSCGWNDGESSYDISDDIIIEAMLNGGELHLPCLNDSDSSEDVSEHRGVYIYLTDSTKMQGFQYEEH